MSVDLEKQTSELRQRLNAVIDAWPEFKTFPVVSESSPAEPEPQSFEGGAATSDRDLSEPEEIHSESKEENQQKKRKSRKEKRRPKKHRRRHDSSSENDSESESRSNRSRKKRGAKPKLAKLSKLIRAASSSMPRPITFRAEIAEGEPDSGSNEPAAFAILPVLEHHEQRLRIRDTDVIGLMPDSFYADFVEPGSVILVDGIVSLRRVPAKLLCIDEDIRDTLPPNKYFQVICVNVSNWERVS